MGGTRRTIPFDKPAVFLLCLAPLILLLRNLFTNNLSANPIDDITDTTGIWTLRFLLITLSVTPARQLSGWNGLIRFRRMFGLFAFSYAVLHFTTYIWLDQFFALGEMVRDVAERPFITVGFTSFVLLIPLAVTSTRKWVVRIGGRHWQWLHRLVYVSSIGGVVHYLWLVKADTRSPLIYGVLLSILLGYRLLRPRMPAMAPGSRKEAMRAKAQL